MCDEDKPYVALRNGWMVQITPRNAAGWCGLGAWLLPFLVLAGVFTAVVSRELGDTVQFALTGLFLLVTVGLCIQMIRGIWPAPRLSTSRNSRRSSAGRRAAGNAEPYRCD